MIKVIRSAIGSWRLKRIMMLPWLIRRRVRDLDDMKRFRGLKNAKAITFDVFDTALSRAVAQPEDAIALAVWRLEQRNGLGLEVRPLLEARLNAEIEARARARAQGRHEVTLDEIYDSLPSEWLHLKSALRDEELSTERDVCYANPAALALFRHAIESGAQVAFVSDTYFSREFVSELLTHAGYEGSYQVFVSSAFGTSKSRGDLFSIAADRLGCAPSQIWHIGDNVRSDVVQARRRGLNSLWFHPRRRRLLSSVRGKVAGDARAISRSLITGIGDSLSVEGADAKAPWREIGLTIAGPVYLGFVQWLIAGVEKFAPRRVYFFSRDGKIIQEVYDRVRSSYRDAPESRYLMVSRRSLSFPGITRIDDLSLKVLSGSAALMPVEEYLTRIGIDPEHCQAEMSEQGIPRGTFIDSEDRRKRLRNLFRSLEPKILEAASRERVLLARYLEQEGCFEVEKFAFCDIGWWGSLQRALAPILRANRPDVQVRGYYAGTHKGREADFGGEAFGWLIDADVPEDRRRTIQSGIALIELLFTAKHGSVVGYAEHQGKIDASLALLEIDEDYADAAQEVQHAALAFVGAYARACGDIAPINLDCDQAFAPLARLIDRPTAVEASALGDLVMVEGMGTRQYGQPMARPPNLWDTLRKPGTLVEKYRQSQWRHGFLVRLIGVPGIVSAAVKLRRLLEPRTKYA
jgi:predicted HAD superfamily hydrolase